MATTTAPPNVTGGATAPDQGLAALVMLLRFQGIGADPEQIRHRFGRDTIGVPEMLRCAKDLGLKARAYKTSWDAARLDAAARHRGAARWRLPAARQGRRRQGDRPVAAVAAADADDAGRVRGGLGRPARADDAPRRPRSTCRAASTSPGSSAPSTNTATCSARCWSPRSSCSSSRWSRRCSSRSSSTRCWCIAASSTLDVLVIGLVDDLGLRDHPRHPAHLCVRPHHQPHRRRARRAAVPPSAGAADRLFPGAARRRFGRARARAGEHPQFPHQLGADAGHRPVLHLRVPGGDVHLLAAPDLHRARRRSRSISRISALARRRCSAAGSTRNSSAAPRTRPSWSRASPASRRSRRWRSSRRCSAAGRSSSPAMSRRASACSASATRRARCVQLVNKLVTAGDALFRRQAGHRRRA